MTTQSAYLTRQLKRSHEVLADPTASLPKRRGARCRINRSVTALQAHIPADLVMRSIWRPKHEGGRYVLAGMPTPRPTKGGRRRAA